MLCLGDIAHSIFSFFNFAHTPAMDDRAAVDISAFIVGRRRKAGKHHSKCSTFGKWSVAPGGLDCGSGRVTSMSPDVVPFKHTCCLVNDLFFLNQKVQVQVKSYL
ncbi:hypothetical protein XENOCAPTIV_028792 [Xenoophorus captivus]|uniref:Uncharacterized protein n=1 Tax=Xenoophorus captivus TaxID=1517983 RepID=A0ABV0QNL1_9TELE